MSDLDTLVARAKTAGVVRAYKIGEVPATPGDTYMVLSLDVGFRSSTRVDGRSPNRVRRLAVQLNARSDDGFRDMATRADAAFNEVTLTGIATSPYCWREMHVGPTRDPDAGGWIYGMNTYRF